MPSRKEVQLGILPDGTRGVIKIGFGTKTNLKCATSLEPKQTQLALIKEWGTIVLNQDLRYPENQWSEISQPNRLNERKPTGKAVANKDGKSRRDRKALRSFGPKANAGI